MAKSDDVTADFDDAIADPDDATADPDDATADPDDVTVDFNDVTADPDGVTSDPGCCSDFLGRPLFFVFFGDDTTSGFFSSGCFGATASGP